MKQKGQPEAAAPFSIEQGRYADPSFTELELAAIEWLDGFYQLEHLLAARRWAIRLAGEATPELRFAALVHDAERFFPGGPSNMPQDGFDNPDYLFVHSLRSADIVDEWLDRQNKHLSQTFRKRVRALILRHELGGNPEEDILQAADSLSFLSTFDWLVVGWVREGKYTVDGACEKLDWMLTRIRVPAALQLALPFYVDVVTKARQASELGLDVPRLRTLASNRAHLLERSDQQLTRSG